MAEKLARTRAKRGSNRSVKTKLSNEAKDLLQVELINKQRLEFITASPNENSRFMDLWQLINED